MKIKNKVHGLVYTLAILLLLSGATHAQDKSISKELYQATGIPDCLKQDAHAVIRYTINEVTVLAPGKTVTKHHSLVTVLDEKGDSNGTLVLGYDKKFRSVNSMQMLVYDAEGKLLKKYNKSDAYDGSATDGVSIVTDARFLGIRHEISTYPTTIEVIYETSTNSYLDLSEWQIQPKETAVQNSVYKITVNSNAGFRYKNKNTSLIPQKQLVDGMDVYTWQVNNLKAVNTEDDVPAWRVTPRITFATNGFSYDGLPGDISSWQNYGKWYQKLNADVCTLSPQREAEVKQMVANLKTDQEKARFLYSYLQQNVRYVSVQLGIGGLKPFSATFVDQKKYGDCKALVNYMYAMLKAAGIRSHYAIVNAGTNEEPADPSFPADPFNHIILCVPFKGDTTWLECTSNTQPYGKLGTFTENRNALLITENGGQLVNTPRSTANDNQFNSQVHLTLDADGGAKAQVKILSTGEYRNLFVAGFPELNQEKQKEYLIRAYNFKQPTEFNFKQSADSAGVKEVDIDVDYDSFCDVSASNKKFYRPYVFDLWRLTLPPVDKRKADYYFDHPMQKTCTTVIDLPAGFEAESVPADVKLKFSYGNYEASYKYDAVKNEVISTVKFLLNQHVIPAARYTEMQQYMDNIARAQGKKLIIHRKAV
ncbi:DUF3857 domain-containing protein [Mucilaginibacter robiniae]|uniref:DUF3857 domain-containing protein n=1 Tax=Mucilaginibacter robiniae TaxID=2728022 RepID=A0A7L5E6J8_9SPHI|nr:DUF3857 and transglutaminase domain-containing protein [Mucilaginibacter robiniae]QJD96463.1 DUF3857 domain-containing protein [Mucilaginibacter robiniae]